MTADEYRALLQLLLYLVGFELGYASADPYRRN
jgi:hypothetical protein